MKIIWGIAAVVYGLFLLNLSKHLISAGASAAYPITKRIPGGGGLFLAIIVGLAVYLVLGLLVVLVGGVIVNHLFE